jgi:hypothetical protein
MRTHSILNLSAGVVLLLIFYRATYVMFRGWA